MPSVKIDKATRDELRRLKGERTYGELVRRLLDLWEFQERNPLPDEEQ